MTDLCRYTRELDAFERARFAEGGERFEALEEVVHRDGAEITVDRLDGLMALVMSRAGTSEWSSPEESDKWLAPRLHEALRLRRSEAGDKGLWHWLALRFSAYVEYRWAGAAGVTRDRWFGPVQKQALARLWWGAELFRDGPDYSPVDFFFQRQDMPNSYLQRPLIRCRPLALALIDQLREVGREAQPKASQVNDLARVLNLTTAGISPEAETGFARDDISRYEEWLDQGPAAADWSVAPIGPDTGRRSERQRRGGMTIAKRGWDLAPGVASARGARGSGPSSAPA